MACCSGYSNSICVTPLARPAFIGNAYFWWMLGALLFVGTLLARKTTVKQLG